MMRRRGILQALLLGIGGVGLGNIVVACKEETVPRKGGEDEPNRNEPEGELPDKDEYVPGESTPVVATSDAPKVPNPTWEARAKQLESEQARLFRATVYTKASPDSVNRSASHVPNARLDAADGGAGGLARVLVVVNHVMGQNKLDAGPPVDAGPRDATVVVDATTDAADAGDADAGDPVDAGVKPPIVEAAPPPEHYITTVFLRANVAGVETVVGLWEFNSTDAAPPTVSFTLPAGVTSVVAYEWCTLHGLWASEPLAISDGG